MYQALYRKYRPETFDEIVGQQVIVQTLKNAVENNKITHAYLFTGPRGTGKTSVAKILAKTINCERPKKGVPCNLCVSCTQINQKQTVDIIEIDAASNNGVDEIREIKSKVNLVPSNSKYKVYIIDEVHMLTTGAFNALLKTLEEPPAHVIFVLATTEPHKIPMTILSRCQRFDFKKITNSEIIKRLKIIVEKEKVNINSDAIEEVARLSDGGMRDSIGILDQAISYTNETITIEDIHEINGTVTKKDLSLFINDLINDNILETIKKIDEYDASGKDIIKLTEEIMLFLKDTLLYKNVPTYFNEKEQENYKQLGEMVNNDKLILMFDTFNSSIPEIKLSNNPKLIFELAIIKIVRGNVKKPIEKDKKEKIEPIKTTKIDETVTITPDFQLKKETNEEIKAKIDQIKKIRIDNTLAKFNKTEYKNIKEDLEGIRNYILNPDYCHTAALILDGELKAASSTNMVFVYKNERIADLFNEHLPIVQKLLSESLNKTYSVIATHKDEWESIKKKFNNKMEQYEYIEETFNIIDILKSNTEKETLESIFGDIIEYK